MLDYLIKFSKLTPEIKNLVSNPATQAVLANLENEYHVSLAALVMRVMIKEVVLTDLNQVLIKELELEKIKADELEFALKNKVFNEAISFLMLGVEKPADVVVPVQTPSEHFGWTETDNKDIKAQQAKIIDQADYDQGIEVKVDQVIRGLAGLIIETPMLKSIIKTFLRGVRDKVHTKEALMRDVQSGGLGLDERIVDAIFLAIKNNQNTVAIINKSKPSLPPESLRDIPYDLSVLVARKDQNKIAAPAKTIDLPIKEQTLSLDEPEQELLLEAPEEELLLVEAPREFEKFLEKEVVRRELEPQETEMQPDTEVDLAKTIADLPVKQSLENIISPVEEIQKISQIETPTQVVSTQTVSPEIVKELSQKVVVADKLLEIAKNAVAEPVIEVVAPKVVVPINNLQKNDHGKFTMEDVKKIDRLIDPIEEIHNLTIKQFRRLANKPSDACAKIKSRINSLEKDNFKYRATAIRAWKTSLINQEYLNLCRLSLKQGQMLMETVRAQAKNNKEALNQEELEAIIKLNHDLSY